MKLVITQLNVGGRLRFIPGGANGTSLHNYPRDGWLTETAARKWAKQNGHEIVKVEKMAGKGEKTFRIEYTYKDRNGRTKTSSPEFVGTSVEPLKKRILEGLERNGDKLISFGKITSKDSVDAVDVIKTKYAEDGFLNVDRETRRKIISYLKTKDSADAVDSIREKYCIDFVMKNDIVHLPRAATYRVEIKINGQPFFPMIALRDAEGTKKDKIAKQAMEYFKKTYWSDPRPFNKSLDKSKAKLTVGKIQYKTDGRSNWEDMR